MDGWIEKQLLKTLVWAYNPIPVGIVLSNIGWGGDIMHKEGCYSHLYGPTFLTRSNAKGLESLRPLQIFEREKNGQ